METKGDGMMGEGTELSAGPTRHADNVGTAGAKAGPYDVLAGDEARRGSASFQRRPLGSRNGRKNEGSEPQAPPYELLDVRALLTYQEQPGEVLCGDAVLEVGEFAMLFGFPSVGKSWAIFDLMVKAAHGSGRWIGHEIKCQFPTLWIGDENNTEVVESAKGDAQGGAAT